VDDLAGEAVGAGWTFRPPVADPEPPDLHVSRAARPSR
jgi:hypothetical protein